MSWLRVLQYLGLQGRLELEVQRAHSDMAAALRRIELLTADLSGEMDRSSYLKQLLERKVGAVELVI
jgi:hypothetical protein